MARVGSSQHAKRASVARRDLGAYALHRALRLRTDAYYQRQQKMSYKETSNQLTQLKKNPDFSWLKDVTAVPLQQALRHLNTAFLN